MDEHEIERAAKAVGARAAGRLDVERVVQGVLSRLRAQPAAVPVRRRAWWSGPMLLRLAAAVAVLAVGGVLTRGAWDHGRETATMATVPMLRDLSVDELAEVFDSLAIEAPVHQGVAVGLESLDEAQLQELLRQMEG